MLSLMAGNRWYGPGSHFVNLAPDDDQAPAQVGDDGSGGDDGGGSGGGSDCAFLRTLRGGTPAGLLRQ